MLAARVVLAAGSLVGALVLLLYGLFAVAYEGDAGQRGDTHVQIAGSEIDADAAGAAAIVIAVVLLGVFVAIVLIGLARSSSARAAELEAVLGASHQNGEVVSVQEGDRDRPDRRAEPPRPRAPGSG